MQEIDWKDVPPLGRLRGHHAEVDRRAGADEPPGGPGPGHLAVRPGPLGRVHLGRQGQVGRALAALARLQQVLGPADALDAAQRHPERHHRHGAAPATKTGEVVVDAVDPKGEFINFLDSQVGVVAPNRERTVIDLEQIGPGRYRGRFPAAAGGRLPGRHGPAQGRARDRLAAGRPGGTVCSGAARSRRRRDACCASWPSSPAAGRSRSPSDAFLKGRRQSRIAVEIWPWLVGLVALLLIPDVALRRLGPGGVRAAGRWLCRQVASPRDGHVRHRGGGDVMRDAGRIAGWTIAAAGGRCAERVPSPRRRRSHAPIVSRAVRRDRPRARRAVDGRGGRRGHRRWASPSTRRSSQVERRARARRSAGRMLERGRRRAGGPRAPRRRGPVRADRHAAAPIWSIQPRLLEIKAAGVDVVALEPMHGAGGRAARRGSRRCRRRTRAP